MSNELHERIIRIESLMEQMKAAADPETRAAALELVQTMMEFHNVGLGRMVEIIQGTGDTGAALMSAFAQDAAVVRMLLVHDLPKPRGVIATGDKHSRHRGHPRRYRHRFN